MYIVVSDIIDIIIFGKKSEKVPELTNKYNVKDKVKIYSMIGRHVHDTINY